MNSKRLFFVVPVSLLLLAPAVLYAQDLEEETGEEAEPQRYSVSLDVEMGGQIVEQDNNSSKFNEYRDNESDPYLYRGYLSVDDTETGRYLDFRGRRLSRDDQELFFDAGLSRYWNMDFSWNGTPHLLGNTAQTPYDYLGDGIYRVAGGIVDDVQISNVDTAATWTLPNAGPGGVGEDSRIASVLRDSVSQIDLGTQRDTGTFGLNFYFNEWTKGRFEFQSDDKDGSILRGVAIGDRPPRSMTLQLPEPIDYNTYDFKFSLENYGDNYSVDARYQYSIFDNDVEQMSWNSLFHAPNFNCAAVPACAGAGDFDRIRYESDLVTLRSTEYATTGTLTLSPDNTYHNVTLNGGVGLPWWNSRLSTSFVYTKMKQDETLLPYATSSFSSGTTGALPRSSADAEIDTTMVNVTYNVSPLRSLNAQLHYRYYNMDNDTPQDVWLGTTQDTNAYSILSQRINIPYDLEQENIGVDLSYYLGKAGTFGFEYELEQIDRPDREVAETDEDIFKFTYRVNPVAWATLMAEYVMADRDGSIYNGEVTDQSYAYDIVANAGNTNNPLLGFANNPSLRKFDVADRDRDEIDISLNILPTERININLGYDFINNDYKTSKISDTINTWDAIALTFVDAFVDPTQLGLLEDETNRYIVQINFSPTDKLNLIGYYSREDMDISQRGRYMDEDERLSGVDGSRDWQTTDGGDIWEADMEDRTDTFALGLTYTAMEDKLNLKADVSHSDGEVELDYSAGFRLAEDDTTSFHNHAEWSSPPDVNFESNSISLGLSYALNEQISLGFNYIFESYSVKDWDEEATSAHRNRVSDNFVTETDGETAGTGNDRVGARLVTLDNLLAPDYEVHWGIITLRYQW